ncbi:MAG: methionine--tRNA ligase subunit beta [Patescibacteria group bacterium]|jgi:methionine--tRNA ligase beta chain
MIKDTITFPDFAKLDIRVGTIEVAERVENSERLVRFEVDLGKEIGKRQIIAGIALQYEAENLLGKQVTVLVNLESKKMMGLESRGMLLAAGEDKIALLKPDKTIANGGIVR